MNTHGFLDQLLKTAQQSLGGGMESLTGSKDAKRAVGGPFGKGALVGGALGLLLGNRKARKMGGKVAVYGGLAALGVMAYKAYGEYQKQKSGTVTAAGSMPATRRTQTVACSSSLAPPASWKWSPRRKVE